MAAHTVKLKKRQDVAEGTTAFYFERAPGFAFQAGQFLEMTLLDPPETDAEGNARTFTIASAPYEEDLIIATRMRNSAFKRVLKTLPPGAEVRIEGPYGNLVLDGDGRPAAFLAGGIGITPFRSMLLEAAKERLPRRLFLFYSNRRPEDAAFLEELQQLEKENSNYKLVATMTAAPEASRPWQGETGHITTEMLARHLGSLTGPIYYVVGPPRMVAAMRSLLFDAGVRDIHSEQFFGY